MKKKTHTILGIIGSMTFLIVYLIITIITETYSVITLLSAFGGAFGFFITWWLVEGYISRKKMNDN